MNTKNFYRDFSAEAFVAATGATYAADGSGQIGTKNLKVMCNHRVDFVEYIQEHRTEIVEILDRKMQTALERGNMLKDLVAEGDEDAILEFIHAQKED